MINISAIICVIAGIILGTIITALFLRSKIIVIKANLENANRLLEETKQLSQADLKAAKEDFEQRLSIMKADELRHYESALEENKKANEAAIASMKEYYDAAIKDQQERFDANMLRLLTENKAATEDMLKARQQEFAETSSINIGQIVTPLKETIAKMEEAMIKTSKESLSISSAMQENMRQLINQSREAQSTTEKLTRALKHESKFQGDWGEIILTQLLESQGLTEGVHFETQATIRDSRGNTIKTEEGCLLRPDVILHIDQKREVIIDSKVSLTAFFDYVNAQTEEEKQQYLKAHIESLKKHVKELSNKDYSSYIQAPKIRMDYVIMFVPHTAALWTALNAEPQLWREAMEQRVYIADEQTLYAALKIIQMNWTQIKQAQNHEEVFRLANEVIDRVGQFVKKYNDVGDALMKALKAFDDGKKKLEDRGQSIVLSANKMVKLGAKQSLKNPVPCLLDVDEVKDVDMISADNNDIGDEGNN